jgi:hypothetical protein
MRRLTAVLFVGPMVLATGCQSWLHRGTGAAADNAPATAEQQVPATTKELVEYLNVCSSRVASIKSDGMWMDCKAGSSTIGLNANMICEKPRNFRLRGFLASQCACDLGSNNEEFWYWIKQDDPPFLYHCSYEAMAQGNVRLPFPFQPDMVVTALGMAEYSTDLSRYEVKMLPKKVELIETAVSAQGKPIKKVTVFARTRVDINDLVKGRPQVIEYDLRDPQGQDVCRAVVEKVTVERGAVVPQKVRLSWPAQKMEIALTLNRVAVNTVDPQLAQSAFNRNDLPYRSFDLARRAPDAGGNTIERVRGNQQ